MDMLQALGVSALARMILPFRLSMICKQETFPLPYFDVVGVVRSESCGGFR